MQILLDHSADIDHETSAGNRQNAVTGCLANGRGEAAVFLADRGARLDLEGAAGVGRLDVVKRFFNADGSLKGKTTRPYWFFLVPACFIFSLTLSKFAL